MWQHDAALDHQRVAPAGLDARRADGLTAGLVPAQQHGGVHVAVQRLDLGEMRDRVAQMVAIGLGTHTAGLGQIGLGTGDANVETEGGGVHVGKSAWVGHARQG